MCWWAISQKDMQIKTADTPIKVFKVCCRNHYNKQRVFSYYMDFNYKEGETYKLPMYTGTRFDIQMWHRYDGFHSYSQDVNITFYRDEYLAVRDQNMQFIDYLQLKQNLVIAECTIPKGAHYYMNQRGEIVSDQIKIESFSDVHSIN